MCFSCESCKSNSIDIGKKIRTKDNQTLPENSTLNQRLLYTADDVYVTGLAVCWGQKDAYYIDLKESTTNSTDISIELPLKLRKKAILQVLNTKCSKDIVAFDMKEQLKILFEITDCLVPISRLFDPKVAQWLLEPGQREKNLHGIVKQWLSEEFVTLTEGTILLFVFNFCLSLGL